MPKTGTCECYFMGASHQRVKGLIGLVKADLGDLSLPAGCSVDIYQGMTPLGSMVVEITGGDEEEIRAIHLRVTSKILEVCERNGVESHGFEPLRIS